MCVCAQLLSHVQLCNSMDNSPPGSSVHGILQARILQWVPISSSRGSSWPRDWTQVSCIGRWILWTTEPLGKPDLCDRRGFLYPESREGPVMVLLVRNSSQSLQRPFDRSGCIHRPDEIKEGCHWVRILLRYYKEDCGWKSRTKQKQNDFKWSYRLFLCISNTHRELGRACHLQWTLSMFIAQARKPPISYKVRFLPFSAAQSNIRFCVSGANGDRCP